MKEESYDVVIIGAGLAGVYCALSLGQDLNVALVSNGSIDETNSYLAQGGVAAPVGEKDTPQSHYQDTMACGHFVNNPAAVTQLTECAKVEVDQLKAYGVQFDTNNDGTYQMGMEGAHSCPRILRIGDFTGKAIIEKLWERVNERSNIHLFSNAFAFDIQMDSSDESTLLILIDEKVNRLNFKKLVIATGGMGRLYSRTSNSPKITGDGIALAIKAGIEVSHLNWIQFHPTVYYNLKGSQAGFLISEAVRGDGGILLNEAGERFMPKYHKMNELAPRDVVSSAILKELSSQSIPHVWLDVRHIGNVKMAQRFPTIYAYCRKQGLDLDVDLIPVAPGAHYAMGGIKVDLQGRTNVKNIYAVGECACTGVHGKNRLASNSLLEALVFSKKVSEDIQKNWHPLEGVSSIPEKTQTSGFDQVPVCDVSVDALKIWMDAHMGIVKDYPNIEAMQLIIDHKIKTPIAWTTANIEDIRKYNLLIVMKHMLAQTIQEYKNEIK